MIPQLSRARSANTIRLSDRFMSLRARKYTVMYVICTNPVGNRNTANEGRLRYLNGHTVLKITVLYRLLSLRSVIAGVARSNRTKQK